MTEAETSIQHSFPTILLLELFADINISPLYEKVLPLVMRLPWQDNYPEYFVYVRYAGDEQSIIQSIEKRVAGNDAWFAYRTSMSLWPFLIVIGTTLLLVIISGGYSAWKAGRLNPVDVIKVE